MIEILRLVVAQQIPWKVTKFKDFDISTTKWRLRKN